jgi:hypothetical protein
MAEDPHAAPPPGGWPPPQPPPQYQQQYPPYGYGQQSPWAPTYHWTYAEPDNNAATGGFITSIASIAVLVFTLGIFSPLTLIASIAGIAVSRNGLQKIERGETTKSRDMAQWGFWLGIAGVVLSLLALAAWVALVVAVPETFDEEAR